MKLFLWCFLGALVIGALTKASPAETVLLFAILRLHYALMDLRKSAGGE
jgi:hypothetical protein